jgi:hypothetical protein
MQLTSPPLSSPMQPLSPPSRPPAQAPVQEEATICAPAVCRPSWSLSVVVHAAEGLTDITSFGTQVHDA